MHRQAFHNLNNVYFLISSIGWSEYLSPKSLNNSSFAQPFIAYIHALLVGIPARDIEDMLL